MLLLLACAADPLPDDTGGADSTPSATGAWADSEHPLFSDRTLQTVRLTLQEDWESVLWNYAQADDPCEPRRTIVGELAFENAVTGVTSDLGSAEVRFRGHSALDDGPSSTTERPGFKIDLEPYGTTYHDREKLNLLGTEGDYSLIREVLAYKLMRQLGLPAPYAGFAQVYVNDVYQGVYPLSEEPDTQGYLDAHFDDPDGNLYKVEGYCGGTGRLTWLGSEPEAYTDIYDAKAGTGDTHADDLIPLLDCASNTGHDEFRACIGEQIEVDTWLLHVAADMVMPDVDGLPSAGQNYMLYADPAAGLTPYSWDKDQAFDLANVTSDSIYALHPVWAADREIELVDRLRQLFADEYCAAVDEAAAWVAPEVLALEVERLRDHLASAIDADPFIDLERWNGVVNDILDVATTHHPSVTAEAQSCTPPTTDDPGWSDATLVAEGSEWRWTNSEPSSDWASGDFDDSGWSNGAAPLGYGTDVETAVEATGITLWFRHSFTLDEAHDGALTLGLMRDDGGVVYLDGEEVARDNLPSGSLTSDTLASERMDGSDEETFWEHDLGSGISAGSHVLAVGLHQASASSGDATFDLWLEVERE